MQKNVFDYGIYLQINVEELWKDLYISSLQNGKRQKEENLYFLIQREGKLLPIEVKAEGNVRSNSLSMLLQARKELHAERYSMLPYKEQESMTNVPLYAV